MSVASSASTTSTAAPAMTAIQRRVSSAHTRISPGWSLIAAPRPADTPRTTGRVSSQRQPIANRRNSSGPTWPSLIAYRNGHDCAASRSTSQRTLVRTGRIATPIDERDEQQADPGRDGGRLRQQPERQHERDERRRVVEQPEAAGRLERGVVRGLPREHPLGGRVVGEEVVAQRRAGDGDRRRDEEHHEADGERRHEPPGGALVHGCVIPARHAGQAAAWSCESEARALARFTSRWMSGIRNRSHATRMARPRPGCMREPRRSAQRIGTTTERVAAAADEEDELDVEHDARDLLAGEDVAGDLAVEALEPALRVLDGADDPQRGERVERLAQQPPPAGLRGAHVGAVGLDARAVGGVGRLERLAQERQLVGRGGHVGVGEHDEVARRVEHPCAHRRALAAVRDGQQLQLAVRGLRSGPDEGRGAVGRPVVHDEDVDRSRAAPPSPGRPSRASVPRRWRYPNSSSRAGPSRASSL